MRRKSKSVYKQLSADMREGLKNIYQQLSSASRVKGSEDDNARALFREASSQLDAVLKSTEEATMQIMEIVEKHLTLQEESQSIITAARAGTATAEQLQQLEKNNVLLGDDLLTLTTSLSFQDLTGQRLKRVLASLNKIESAVVNLYITSGLIMEGAENDPEKNAEVLKDEASKAIEDFRKRSQSSELKGPDKDGVSQNAIDDMLAQLGM